MEAGLENAKAVYAALAEFGAPLKNLNPADFAQPGPFFRMGREPVAVDILTEIPGVQFEEAWGRRVEAVVDFDSGLTGSFISRDDLLAAKRASGRLQDLADVEAIEKALESNRPKR